MNNIEQLWQEYRKTLPQKMSDEMKGEAHLGFKCGCLALFNLMMQKALDDTLAEDEGEKFLTDIRNECLEIIKKIHIAVDSINSQEKA